MLQLLPSSVSHQIPMTETLILIAKCCLIWGWWPPGRNWRVFQKPYGEKWIAYLIFGKEPLIFGNRWGFRRALILVIMIHDHKKWVKGWRQQKCVIISVMDLVEWMIFVELKSNRNWHITKSHLFLGSFVGTPNSCQNFDNSLRWTKKSVESQTFQLSLRIFFLSKDGNNLMLQWSHNRRRLWSWSSVSCSKKLIFFWDMILSPAGFFSIPFSNDRSLATASCCESQQRLVESNTLQPQELGGKTWAATLTMSFGGQWWNATELMWAKYVWLCQRIANGILAGRFWWVYAWGS